MQNLDVYVFPFEPNPNWSSFYVGSPEIWQYMKDTAVKWGLEKFVSFNSRVSETVWDDELGKWKVKVNCSGKTISDECDVLVNASGFLKSVSPFPLGHSSQDAKYFVIVANGHGLLSKDLKISKESVFTPLLG